MSESNDKHCKVCKATYKLSCTRADCPGLNPNGTPRPSLSHVASESVINEVIERAEQACRYVWKHQDMEASEYAKGFEVACEVCEKAIREHVLRHVTPSSSGLETCLAVHDAIHVLEAKLGNDLTMEELRDCLEAVEAIKAAVPLRQNVCTSQQIPTERNTDFVDVAVMREALEDDMGRTRLPDAVRDAIYWLEASGRRHIADGLDGWAREAIQNFWDERDGYIGLKGTTDALLKDLEAKLDAVAEALDMPKESWRIAGCDVLAHQVRDLLANYIKLRDPVTPSASGEEKP